MVYVSSNMWWEGNFSEGFTILYGIQLQKPQRIGTESTKIVRDKLSMRIQIDSFKVLCIVKNFYQENVNKSSFFVFYMYANYSFNMRNTGILEQCSRMP